MVSRKPEPIPARIGLVRGPLGFSLWTKDHGPLLNEEVVEYVPATRVDALAAVAEAARAMMVASDARDEAFEAGRYEDATEFDEDENRAVARLRSALAALPSPSEAP